jgi:dephospho-CoA kinase
VVAVTGGIAEGKSTVLGMLSELGYSTASADDVGREVFQTREVQAELAVLFETTDLSRDAIRAAISAKPDLRRGMNRLMHGPIWERILASGVQFVEIPLLVEACLHPNFRRVWVVTCGQEEQLRRLVERLGSRQAAEQMLSTQLSSTAKAQFADRIVRTNAEPASVLGFVSSAAEADVAR